MADEPLKVVQLTFDLWNGAPWRPQLDAAIKDYLEKSLEEISLQEEWGLIAQAMLGMNGLLALLALDEQGENVLGFLVAHNTAGTQVTGNVCVVWQVYVVPGKAKLQELFPLGWPQLEAFAKAGNASRYTLYTRRMEEWYDKLLQKLGFSLYMKVYSRSV